MQIPIYHVDAFTNKIFHGNPAAVCILSEWLPDEILHGIAQENNLPVTTFLIPGENLFQVRWITPDYELDICGHGSLAAGFVIFNFLQSDSQKANLQSRSEKFQILRSDDYVTLDFPAKKFETANLPLLAEGLGIVPQEIFQHKNERCFAVFANEDEIKQLHPNIQILKKMPHRGITVTAPGANVDFVSRTFYPQKTISEDPATGASHCLLAPYWSEKLNKRDLHALQVSKRGGEIFCRYENERVLINGQGKLYMQGMIALEQQ